MREESELYAGVLEPVPKASVGAELPYEVLAPLSHAGVLCEASAMLQLFYLNDKRTPPP